MQKLWNFGRFWKKWQKNFAMIQTENFKSHNWWRHNWRLFGVRDFYATEIKWSSVQDIVIFQSSKCNHSNAFIKYDSYISRNAKYIPSISPICSIIFQALIDVALVFIVCTRIHSCTRIIFYAECKWNTSLLMCLMSGVLDILC